MANETTQTVNAGPEAIELAAAALRGDVTVAKANPVEDKAKEEVVAKAETPKEGKTEDVAKAEAPAPFKKKDEEEDEEEGKEDVKKALGALLPDLIAQAVNAAFAPLNAELAEVRKSLGVVSEQGQATMNFQAATTSILTRLKDEVEEQREVQKSVAATVEAVAAQPQGRKSAANDAEVVVAKSLPVAPRLDLQPLREWAKETGFSVSERIAFVHRASVGDLEGVPHEIRKAMGVQE